MDQDRHIWSRMSVTSSSTAASGSRFRPGRPSARHRTRPTSRPAGTDRREPTDAGPPNERVRPTLLVVDDERDVLSSVRDWLRIDYRVITYSAAPRRSSISGRARPPT